MKLKVENITGIFSIKYGALLLLVLQNSLLVILMRVSRAHGGPMYSASTAVAVMEVIKFIACSGVITYDKGIQGFIQEIRLVPLSLSLSLSLCVYVWCIVILTFSLTLTLTLNSNSNSNSNPITNLNPTINPEHTLF